MIKDVPPQPSTALYVGVMSGTSVDGIDVVIADFKCDTPNIIHSQCTPFSEHVQSAIQHQIQSPHSVSLDDLGALNSALGHEYSDAVLSALNCANIHTSQIAGIGCHGQTIRHQPDVAHPFSMQLGDANIIAEKTGITTVSDFRSRDIAAGGQGAPLVPSFHHAMFYHTELNRSIVNIGGIANVTYLSPSHPIMGFDVGVGNTLMDAACKIYFNCDFDKNGLIASEGSIDQQLLSELCKAPYFKQQPPKSTGRELFNWDWLQQHLGQSNTSPHNLITTLCEFTAWGIVDAIQTHCPPCDEIIVCGGGAYNTGLMNRIQSLANQTNTADRVIKSDDLGVPAQDVEALAFAWLAMRTLNRQTNNCPEATKAKSSRILGAIHLGDHTSQ